MARSTFVSPTNEKEVMPSRDEIGERAKAGEITVKTHVPTPTRKPKNARKLMGKR